MTGPDSTARSVITRRERAVSAHRRGNNDHHARSETPEIGLRGVSSNYKLAGRCNHLVADCRLFVVRVLTVGICAILNPPVMGLTNTLFLARESRGRRRWRPENHT